MKRLQGTMNLVAGDSFTRDTTRGCNEVMFPSMLQSETRQELFPIFCNLCGLQFGFVREKGIKGYCDETCKHIGEIIDGYQFGAVK